MSAEHCKKLIKEEGTWSDFCRVSSGENAADAINLIENSVVGRSQEKARDRQSAEGFETRASFSM